MGSSPWSQDMEYDAWGNMNIPTASGAPTLNLTKTDDNQIDTSVHTGYSFDASGNQTEDPGVSAGTLKYDAEGRVYEIGTSIEYGYDGLGRRVWKRTGIGTGSEEKRGYFINAVTLRLRSVQAGALHPEQRYDSTTSTWKNHRGRYYLNGLQLASQKKGEWWKYTFQDNLGTMRVRTNRTGSTVNLGRTTAPPGRVS